MKLSISRAIGLAVAFGAVPIIGGTYPSDISYLTLATQSPVPTQSPDSTSGSDGVPKPLAEDRLSDEQKMSSNDEERVLQFAERQEPQLFELLKFLKQKRPVAYEQALRETGRTQQRLENLQQKDAELYQIESQIWRTRSKLSLIVARLSVRHSDDLENQLELLVHELNTQEIAKIKLMRDRAARQLDKWESQLKDRSDNSSSVVEKNLESWKNRIKKQSSSRAKS